MNPGDAPRDSLWVRFWHRPVRAERLAALRILLALALLTDELFQYLPNLDEFFGPGSASPAGLHAEQQLWQWKISYWFFGTDNLAILYPAFALWAAATVLFLVGWRTRWTNLAVWLLTRCFIERNPNLKNGADDVLQWGILLLLLSPCGMALSLDAWRLRRKGALAGPAWVPPWSLRLIQLQLCLIYCTTGLIKLKGETWMKADVPLTFGWTYPFCSWLTGTWWDGTSVYYLFNFTTLGRWSYAQLPVPFWMTALMTYSSVWFETLFPLLMLHRRTRWPALAFGVLFHLGIYLSTEVGWFSFYILCFYVVWTPCRFWGRFDRPAAGAASAKDAPAAKAAALPAGA
jgi:hypothetical protein